MLAAGRKGPQIPQPLSVFSKQVDPGTSSPWAAPEVIIDGSQPYRCPPCPSCAHVLAKPSLPVAVLRCADSGLVVGGPVFNSVLLSNYLAGMVV